MHHVAIDIGASGGTVYLGRVSASSFELEEVHRFANRPVEQHGRYVWDVGVLRERIAESLQIAEEARGGIDVVGIDTWGLDFGLLQEGELLRNPISYRDPAATTTRKELFERVGKRRLFEETGITHWNTPNTLLQLHTIAREEPALLERADELSMTPQLLTSLLGGRNAGEVTIASSTQMVDPASRDWASDLLDELSLPTEILPTLEEPGARLGPVADDLAEGLSATPELILTASHDTASAVAGLPLTENAAFLNTGSWFVLGVERDDPVRTAAAFEESFANELGADRTIRLLKNVTGFFLLEECREAWRAAGEPVAYEQLLSAARDAPARDCVIDPDADDFGIEGSMPDRIRSYCRRTDQPVPTDRGAVVRCLLDSLVAKTAIAFDRLARVTGSTPDSICLGGGGARNEWLCRSLADATGRPVRAGPIEATAVGNILTQAVGVDTLPSVEAGRRLLAEQFEIERYEPDPEADWERAKARVEALAED
jgi:rhamnulokinase